MWNRAKLASGANAPMTMLMPSVRSVSHDRLGLAVRGFRTDCVYSGRHHDAQPREQRDDVDGEGHEEGIAPAPVEEILRRQAMDEVGEQRARHHQAERRAELRDHRVPAAPLLRRVHRQQRGAARPRCRRAPGPARSRRMHRMTMRGRADLLVAGQEGHRDRRGAEQEQRDRQLDAAAIDAVDRHEDDGADGARDEGKRKDGERIERAGQGLDDAGRRASGRRRPRRWRRRRSRRIPTCGR